MLLLSKYGKKPFFFPRGRSTHSQFSLSEQLAAFAAFFNSSSQLPPFPGMALFSPTVPEVLFPLNAWPTSGCLKQRKCYAFTVLFFFFLFLLIVFFFFSPAAPKTPLFPPFPSCLELLPLRESMFFAPPFFSSMRYFFSFLPPFPV